MTNNVVHIAAANSYYGRAAGLAFQRCKAKCFLNTGMNEEIGGAIKAGEFARIGTIANPRKIVGSHLQFPKVNSIGPIADHEQMKFIRPASLQTSERAKQGRCVLLSRQPPNVKKQILT